MFRRQRRSSGWQQALGGLGCIAAGIGLIIGLRLLIQRLDAVLLVSEALSHLISGLSHLGVGLGQLGGLLLLLLTTLGALLLLVAGLIRLGRPLLPAGPGDNGQPRQGSPSQPPLNTAKRGLPSRRRS
ncbi:MAG: hypothetical protein ACKOCM_05445 [Cyanobacteriota bacterium]